MSHLYAPDYQKTAKKLQVKEGMVPYARGPHPVCDLYLRLYTFFGMLKAWRSMQLSSIAERCCVMCGSEILN